MNKRKRHSQLFSLPRRGWPPGRYNRWRKNAQLCEFHSRRVVLINIFSKIFLAPRKFHRQTLFLPPLKNHHTPQLSYEYILSVNVRTEGHSVESLIRMRDNFYFYESKNKLRFLPTINKSTRGLLFGWFQRQACTILQLIFFFKR